MLFLHFWASAEQETWGNIYAVCCDINNHSYETSINGWVCVSGGGGERANIKQVQHDNFLSPPHSSLWHGKLFLWIFQFPVSEYASSHTWRERWVTASLHVSWHTLDQGPAGHWKPLKPSEPTMKQGHEKGHKQGAPSKSLEGTWLGERRLSHFALYYHFSGEDQSARSL